MKVPRRPRMDTTVIQSRILSSLRGPDEGGMYYDASGQCSFQQDVPNRGVLHQNEVMS